MMTPCLCNKVVVFDLDDTLYKEEDFLFSGFNAIAHRVAAASPLLNAELIAVQMKQWRLDSKNVFEELCKICSDKITKEECLEIYRNHRPAIALSDDSLKLLKSLKALNVKMGIITDGREITQRNKIKALGLDKFISWDDIVISESFGSEKPSNRNYNYFMERYPQAHYVYVGDNVNKDFITPNRLGWQTICLLDNGRNIHKQKFDVDTDSLANKNINSLKEVLNII